jgi:hypothetical protein
MPRIARFLVASGFLWIALWAVMGSLLGARINLGIAQGDEIWLGSLQRELLRTAHAHMNTLSYGAILMGLSWVAARRCVSERALLRAAWGVLVGIPLFGLGLTLEAFWPTQRGDFAPVALLTAAGGTCVIFSFAAWGLFFLQRHKEP